MSDVHLFLFFLLVTGFFWDAGGVPVSWKTRSLSVKRARSICSMHLLAGAVKEDYEAGLKMVDAKRGEHGESSMARPL